MDSTYHHGSLRDALLAEGRRLLLEKGPEAVTLRELARRTGVSHAAPSRHFTDRDALLGALAADGFDELTRQLQDSSRLASLHDRLDAYAHAHVRFAVENGPLMALMFSRTRRPGDADADAALRFYALGAELLGETPGAPVGPVPYVLAGTLEGISGLIVSGRLAPDDVDTVIAEAVAMLLPRVRAQLEGGSGGRAVLPSS
ncbi:TetR/AcrR family transcriptional regulator [Leifsonia sp. LS-T14]|uniref:TetR/AcrR family transcriptional regulator n=1 Tax=unclassified Leifsonia TaxID=2663824 RepID=UPI0035A5E989